MFFCGSGTEVISHHKSIQWIGSMDSQQYQYRSVCLGVVVHSQDLQIIYSYHGKFAKHMWNIKAQKQQVF